MLIIPQPNAATSAIPNVPLIAMVSQVKSSSSMDYPPARIFKPRF